MHVVFSKGTLVPRTVPSGPLFVEASANVDSLQHREKRAREAGGDSGAGPLVRADGRSTSSSAGMGPCRAHSAGLPSFEQLVSAHEQLLQCVHATLSVEEESPARGAEGDGSDPTPVLDDGQRAALAALVDPLHRSLATLQGHPLADASHLTMPAEAQAAMGASMGADEVAAEGVEKRVAMSIPPSPPNTGSTSISTSLRGRPPSSSTRSGAASPAGPEKLTPPISPWISRAPLLVEKEETLPHESTGLLECIDEPVSCLTALLCCPTLLAQLWVRRGLRYSTAAQRRCICLLTACVLWLGMGAMVFQGMELSDEGLKYLLTRTGWGAVGSGSPPELFTFTRTPQYMDTAMRLPSPTAEEARWCNASAWCTELIERADEWHDLHYLCSNTSFDAALVAKSNAPSRVAVLGTVLLRNGTRLQEYVSVSGAEGSSTRDAHNGRSKGSQYITFSHYAGLVLCVLCSILFVCSVLILCSARRKQKGTRGVSGTLSDCCAAVWCLPCLLCQLSRQEGLAAGKYKMFASDGRGADILPVRS